jgi:hypothetical protein
MKRTAIELTLTLLFLIFINCGKPAANMQEGKWEMTIRTEMTGMPGMIPAMTYTNCLTKDDMNPQKKESSQDCRQTSSQLDGDTYTWDMECTSSGRTAKSSGNITYKGTTLDGTIVVTTQGMTMTQKITGKRIGDCDK